MNINNFCCYKCKFYDEEPIHKNFYGDERPIAWGCCRKLNEDIICSDPYNQVKGDCPLKEDN